MSKEDKEKRQAEWEARAAEAATAHKHAPVPRQTPEEAAAADQGPDSDARRSACALMATNKLTVDGPHNVLLILTAWDETNSSYKGMTVRSHTDKDEHLPVINHVTGYVPFSPTERTPFVFVECGEDTSVIRNHMRHLAARDAPVEEVQSQG